MKTSIVITTFDRTDQLTETLVSIALQYDAMLTTEVIVVDDGSEDEAENVRELCYAGEVRYIRVDRSPSSHFRNPAYPNNVGIRAATGDVVILQNAECRHVDPQTIARLTELVTPVNAVFARVIALNPDGSKGMVYCGRENPRPYFFCGAIRREWLMRLRGFDEDYDGAGYDDDDLADRLGGSGVEFVFSDVEVHHQWHPPAGDYSSAPEMRALYQQKLDAMLRGELGVERNIGRNWGGQP